MTIPKEFMDRLHLQEGDYISVDCDDSCIRVRPVVVDEFTDKDYKKLAAKLDQLRKEQGTRCEDSDKARKHLESLMK
jgi:antitoxin component of MazEF toxin-antitoxin module